MAYDCLLKLPPLDAIILIARYYSEWTDRRIAVQLLGLEDCSAATQRAFRLRNKALQRLRTILLAHGLNGE